MIVMEIHGYKVTLDNDVDRTSTLKACQSRHRDFTDVLSCGVKRGVLQEQHVASADLSIILQIIRNDT